ncbi:MAG: polymer-forming cytoskeletal protein [Candidatus Omnitrophica bacterium]|nr:polymer-forming cytoskeletal protein [Candidatus Omnitrophota bacterium]
MPLRRARPEEAAQDRVLDVDAGMQGSLSFRDPVNLRINGRFEGRLTTRGQLTIGEKAEVRATIEGESVVIAGRLEGDITVTQRLEIASTGRVSGNIRTPVLVVQEGAILQGQCVMGQASGSESEFLTIEEMARYLEVEPAAIHEWATSGRMPAVKDGAGWRFDRTKIDEWIAQEKIK